MSSASVVGAVVERYAGFAVASTAPLYFGEAPLRNAAGAAVVPPYVVLVDDGTQVGYDLELNPFETTHLRFEVLAPTLAQADAIAAGIRLNGQPVAAGAGMDFCEMGTGLDLIGLSLKTMFRESERRSQEPDRGADAKPVYRVSMRYVVECQRTA